SVGDCILLTHHGFGYCILVGGPRAEDVERHVKKLETGFSADTDRKGWHEQPPPEDTFTSADRRLSGKAPKGVWEKILPPNEEFKTGTLLLLGRPLKEKDNQKNAHLQVFTLTKQADLTEAIKQAKEVLDRQMKELNSGYKLEVAPETGTSETGVV